MSEVSVFDVAHSILSRTEHGNMSPLKLQKLCFYAFGWYGHLTGQRLFVEPFYAMERGPVVGPLLSDHFGHYTYGIGSLRAAHPDSTIIDDPYIKSVIDAVWETYGSSTPHELVDMTHDEQVWIDAWQGRSPGSKRGEIDSFEAVEFFLGKQEVKPGLSRMLPDRQVSVLTVEAIDRMETEVAEPHLAFVSRVTSILKPQATA